MSETHRSVYTRPTHIREFDQEEWAAKHGVLPEFLPFDWNTIDPIDALCTIRSLIDTQPQTAKTIPLTKIKDEVGFDRRGKTSKIEPLVELHGGWQISGARKNRFVNPEYVHIDKLDSQFTVSETETRIEILNRLVRYGVPELKDAAPRFGIKQDSLERFARRHNLNWRVRRQHGLTNMARTWETLRDWGYDLAVLGQAFGYTPASIRSMISEKTSDEFEPPADPTKRLASQSL